MIARACAWQEVDWLTKMNVRPKDGRPIWGDSRRVDADLAAIAKEVAAIIKTGGPLTPATSSVYENSEGAGKLKEIIVSGKVEQFAGLVEVERRRTGHANLSYHDKVLPARLYGPITGGASKIALMYWLVVVNSYDGFLNAYERGDTRFHVNGPFGRLELFPGLTLDDYDREARRQQSSLSNILGVGEMCVSELPGGKIRVIFDVGRFHQQDDFWRWVDSFIAEMERHHFKQSIEIISSKLENPTEYRQLDSLDRDFHDAQITGIKSRLIDHTRNLNKLLEQAARYGGHWNAPLNIQNEIKMIEDYIAELEEELRKLEQGS